MKTASSYRIRRATSSLADDVTWASLRHELWPDCPPERHAVEKELYERSPGIVLFAEDLVGTAIGFAEVSLRTSPVTGSSGSITPYLEGWYVDPEWRDRGIGAALIEDACEWARNAGYRELASDTEVDNRASQSAHQRLGFREVERTITYLRPL